MTDISDIVRDPRWLADRYDPQHDAVHFRYVDREQHRAATFLTNEYLGENTDPFVVRRSDALAVAPAQAPLHFIFHSAYCCSTLLARAFDIPGRSMGLKEPLILNDMVGWRHRGGDPQSILQVLGDSLRLLARGFEPTEAVIVKPSNLLNSMAAAMLQLHPNANALLLRAPLPIFLKSVAAKGLTGRLWVRDLLMKQLRDDFVDLGFESTDYFGLTDLQVAAVGWIAQQAQFERMAEKFGSARVRTLDSETLLARPREALAAIAALFRIPLSDDELEAVLCGPAFLTNSKTGAAYDTAMRAAGYEAAAANYADEITKVCLWGEAVAKNAHVELEASLPLLDRVVAASRHALQTPPPASLAPNEISHLARAADDDMRAGRTSAAIAKYRELARHRPEQPDTWYNLGYLLRCTRNYEQALDNYRRALEMGIDRPEEVYLNMAVIQSEFLNDSAAALHTLETAIAINPAFIPALINLGNLYEDMGRPDDARRVYQTILQIDPENGRAIGRKAIVDLFNSGAGNVIASLSAARSRAGRPDDISEIAFALGHVLDADARYDEAFAAFSEANEAALKSQRALPRYDRAGHEQFIRSLIDTFDGAPTARVDDAGNPPIFICGMFRSGSTLAEQLLARHSLVTAGGEIETIPALVAEQLMPYPAAIRSWSPARLDALRSDYLAEINALYPDADRLTDKRPDNFLHIGLIKSMFPDAKFIHTKRQPLDNILSIYFGNFSDAVRYSYDIDDIAHWYRQYLALMDHWCGIYSDDIFTLDYDQLVNNASDIITDMLRFCELDPEPSCYTNGATAGAIRTLSAWQVRQPLHQKSSGRWRNYARHIEYLKF